MASCELEIIPKGVGYFRRHWSTALLDVTSAGLLPSGSPLKVLFTYAQGDAVQGTAIPSADMRHTDLEDGGNFGYPGTVRKIGVLVDAADIETYTRAAMRTLLMNVVLVLRKGSRTIPIGHLMDYVLGPQLQGDVVNDAIGAAILQRVQVKGTCRQLVDCPPVHVSTDNKDKFSVELHFPEAVTVYTGATDVWITCYVEVEPDLV